MAVETGRPAQPAASGGPTARGRGRGADVRKPARARRVLSTHWYAWAMIAPVVLVLGVIIGFPLLRGVYLSLTNADERNVGRTIGARTLEPTYEFVGLDNYVEVLTGDVFWGRLAWTVVWTVACVSLTFLIGLALANMLNRAVRGRTLYRIALILPWGIPAFVSVFAWRLLFAGDGMFNAVLTGGGIEGVDWLEHPTWAKLAVITVNIWIGVPFMLVATLGALQSVPGELYEAAEMDGAGPWQRFRNITVPGIRSVSATVILLSTIWTFNMFPVIFLLTGGGPYGSSEILVTEAFNLAFVRSPRDFATSATWGVLILLLLVAFAVLYRRSLRKQGEVW
ncbi:MULTISPECIES: carbohydrate ABC transporter permease [Streptomyces]|uniref:carbohydrate ABC transporter permease n=1 Tax=Streptomyces TaxID=1883 RepID=UPI0022498923|nr:sugar ABC transporter permease [Streptomyces sp. JHD 1]MCX2967776.1 sugar ABC transporter permease [Streptomyces sp. JHD 1]